MSDLSDFLRARRVPEATIALMEEQKIDCDVAATLKNYGDGIAVLNFY